MLPKKSVCVPSDGISTLGCLLLPVKIHQCTYRDINYKATSFDVNDTHVDGHKYMTGYYLILQLEKSERVICKIIV